MKEARCRIARDGDFENGWNKLFGFSSARLSGEEYPVEVEDALCAMDSALCGKTREACKDGDIADLVCLGGRFGEPWLLLCEPKLRTREVE